ncbi:hypothetical protein BC938DRAFT_473796 [Jimgerdemannia flammicorona]|uniref:BRCT domain-containing protein n=1 Tax=Jimgerdemannia flammicorona TaxID=994334 RepID=A0A433QT23_9FUNG|nr:hypothetical protein BC938DRAFT_473796 [Jimgerdemannia flammicorona]
MEVPELGIKAVLPHWFDDCFKLRRIVSEDMYLFPDPPLLRLDLWADSVSTVTTAATSTHTINTLSLPSPSQPQPAAAGTSSSRRPLPLANASSALANTTSTMGSFVPQPKEPWIFPGPSNATPIPEPSSKFLMGFRFYLCEDLHVNKNLRTTFEERLTQAGATVVAQGRPYRSSGVDCFVGKYREGDGYIQACRDGKVVGSLFWLQHIFNTQRMESPKNLLLNYPQPKEKLPEFENFVITVSNYTGVTRDYVKRLIYILGASYTPHMTPANTHVICAAPTGDKFTKALEWNTHVVNHLWLEECYQQWTCKSIADERYTYFPEGAKMEDLVGRTPVLSFEVEKWWKPGEDEEEEQEKMTGAEIQDDGEGGDESRSESVSNIVTSVTDTDKDTTTPSRTKHKPLGTGSVTTVSKQPRQAAVNASSMLHEVIMPDVVAFQKEMRTPTRRGVKSSSAGAGSTNSGSGDSVGKRRRHKSREGEDEVESIKRKSNKRSRKESEVSDEGTMAEEGEEEQEEDLEERQGQIASTEVTPTRAKGRSKAMLDRSRSSSVTESANEKVKERRSHDTSADTTPTKGLPGGGVRVLTTGYRLSAQEIKGLKSLGVRMATTPRDCTHLIADRVARTEKFLSCVSIAQHILSLGWVTTSIEQGHLVDEKPYMLKDTKAEKQYKFRLAKSLEKAKQGKLLAGKEVYITQNTQPAKETMKEIVECAGGKLVNAVSVRKIRDGAASGSLLIISCDEDRDRWDEFRAYGLDVHSPELLLTGVLRQELNVNGKEFKLVG